MPGYGLRLLWHQRAFSLVAILTLALGIGMMTALVSVIDAAMLRAVPYSHPEQIVNVRIDTPQRSGERFELTPSVDDMRIMRDSNRAFSEVAVWRDITVPPISDGSQPERLPGFEISEDYLKLYGITPILGRGIQAEDTRVGAPAVVLLGYDYWQSRLGGSREVLGQTIRFDSGAATIVGVLPAGFYHATPIWRPLRVTPFVLSRRGIGTTIDGRLRPGVPLERAQRELTDLLASQPGATKGQAVVLEPLLGYVTRSYVTTVNILASAVALILLIACVNVAGLLLGKGAARLPELAIRASIGAGRLRLLRQLLTESLVLSIAGGLAGVAVAWVTLDTLVANIPMSLPDNSPVALNLRVLAFSGGLSLATGLFFGLAPALHLSRVRVTGLIARGARPGGSPLSRRGGQVLIALEVALAVILLAGAGLMIRSFSRILSVDLGINPAAIMTLEVTPVNRSAASFESYYPALLERLRTLPGIAAAGAIDNLPLMGSSTGTQAHVDGAAIGVKILQVLPGYFETVGLPLRSGRSPSDADRTSGRHVVVLSQLAAKTLFSDRDAIGRTFDINDDLVEVIGVVADVRSKGPLMPVAPEVYLLFRPATDPWLRALTIVVRTSGSVPGLPDRLREAARSVGPRVLIDRVRTGDAWLGDRIITPKRRTVLLGLLGGLGLVLALIGVFGMTAYAVERRTQEIGVRIAFGARPRDVLTTMLGDAALPVGVGIVVGLGGATVATRLIASFLFDTTPTDPATLAAVAVLLSAAAAGAAWIPARRAARVDPVIALRAE